MAAAAVSKRQAEASLASGMEVDDAGLGNMAETSSSGVPQEDLYSRFKGLTRQLEFLEIQVRG